ncbi:MAG: LysR family transcriptional regulator [Novosphingobium sp.]|nr:LysR family transcriptional regulator [Novosphingobium sp.]MBO9601468.1 LysR family transcriptional regulator [Novosphingobium sp.]
MTHLPPATHTPRPAAEYRWTPSKALAFIEELARHGKVAAAARSVGMTRQSAYRLRDRVPQVAEIWPRAQAAGRARRCGKAALSAAQGDTSGAAR